MIHYSKGLNHPSPSQYILAMKKLYLNLLLLGSSCFAFGQTFTNSNLPILIVTVPEPIPDEPKATGTLKIIDNGPSSTNQVSGTPNGYNSFIGIERRGSTSQDLSEKKPYSIETRNALGSDSAVSLLGMPAESDWILRAC